MHASAVYNATAATIAGHNDCSSLTERELRSVDCIVVFIGAHIDPTNSTYRKQNKNRSPKPARPKRIPDMCYCFWKPMQQWHLFHWFDFECCRKMRNAMHNFKIQCTLYGCSLAVLRIALRSQWFIDWNYHLIDFWNDSDSSFNNVLLHCST